MGALALLASLALPWLAGCMLLALVRWPAPGFTTPPTSAAAPGRIALLLGYGYFVGLLVLTLWMRILSAVGLTMGRLSIGLPLALVGGAAIVGAVRNRRIAWQRALAVAMAILQPPWPRWQRLLWLVLLIWLALRFVTIAAEIGVRPLYPWDAWTQWATKARVWYAVGRMVPFVTADEWLAGTGAYFDAAPGSPATVPLIQAWSAIALGRWDDSAINAPWLFMLLALALAVYGTLRDRGVHPLGALAGAYLVSSLPLADTHAALAGYADLVLAGVYTLAALALQRWCMRRSAIDGVIAIFLAAACPSIDVSGRAWVALLVAGVVVALWPRRGLKFVAWTWAVAALALVAFARETPWLAGFALHATLPWRTLGETFFLFDNWHLLWYAAIAVAAVGARRLVRQPLAPLTAMVGSSVAWLIVAALFSTDLARWFPVAAAINRAALHVAPLVTVWTVLLWRELAASREEPGTSPALTHA
jgi:hypothetical protein